MTQNNLPVPVDISMNIEIKAKWLKALRSGEYQKAVRAFRINDSFDVFGVLCDILYPDDWQPLHQLHYLPKTYKHKLIFYHNIEKVLAEAKIHDIVIVDLTKMNDVEGKSFQEIATWIEKNL